MVKENKKTIKNFINILEVVYSLFLAAGLANLLFQYDYKATYIVLLIICILAITRFFFAPSKNIEDLLNKINIKGKKYKYRNIQYSLVMWFDVPILFVHAIVFSLMCNFAAQQSFYFFIWSFFSLLALNATWLLTICLREGKCDDLYYNSKKFWIHLNYFFAALILLFILNFNLFSVSFFDINLIYYIICFLCFLNCFIDLMTQYKTYLFHDKSEGFFDI